MLLWIVKFTPNAPMNLPIMFNVYLKPILAPERPAELEPSKPPTSSPVQKTQKSPTPTTNRIKHNAFTEPTPNPEPKPIATQASTEQPVTSINISANIDLPNPKISTESLLESARRIAIEEAKNMPKEKGDDIALADRPISPEIAKAIGKKKKRKAEAGTFTVNGVVIQVNPDGSSNCFLPPPESSMPYGSFSPPTLGTPCPGD